MKNILLTRPHQDSQALAEIFVQNNFGIFVEPLFTVKKKLAPKKPDAATSAIIITSANACDAVANCDLNHDIKIFAVGQKTAQKLSEFGFNNIVTAPQNSAVSLQNLIINFAPKKIAYFHGSIITVDFSKTLATYGFEVEKILAYQTFAQENFSTEFVQFSQKNFCDFVTIFSQNSAQIFFDLTTKHNLLEYFKASQILCLSDKILSDVKNFGFTNSANFATFPILKKFYD